MRSLAAAALAAATVLACRSAPSGAPKAEPVTTVSDADLGRLAPEQMGPLRTARDDRAAAHDSLSLAQLRLQQSRHEEAFGRADRAQADADRQRAEAELRSAQDAGDARLVARATEAHEAAALRAQAADARIEYAHRLVAAREAEVQAADAHVRRAEWDVERAKLAALREADIPAATRYDPGPLDRRAAEAARAEEALVSKARELDRAAVIARDRWRGLLDRYEARARGVQGAG